MIQPEPEGSTQGYLLVSIEVLRYDKRSKSENTGIVLAEMELILEHTQQGISHEVSVEARLVEFKEQEIKFYEKIRGLETDVEPPPCTSYSPLKKDLSWTGLPEFIDATVTDYSRPTPSIDTSIGDTSDLQSSNFSVSELGESSSSIMSKPMIKFVKAADCHRVTKTYNTENARKSTMKYAEIQVNTARPKVVINVVRTNRVNDVKASVCWVWRPIKPNSASITLKRYDYVYVRGRSRISYALSWKPCQGDSLNLPDHMY
nr:hypothetical protein [Tanacetum cinerariifolium]